LTDRKINFLHDRFYEEFDENATSRIASSKIHLNGDSLPHVKNYPNGRTMMPSASGKEPGERGVEDEAEHGD
jgi:hypothetical protein